MRLSLNDGILWLSLNAIAQYGYYLTSLHFMLLLSVISLNIFTLQLSLNAAALWLSLNVIALWLTI